MSPVCRSCRRRRPLRPVGHPQALAAVLQPSTALATRSSMTARRGSCASTKRCAQPAGQFRLRLEPRHHRDRYLRVQRPQDRDRAQTERSSAVNQDAARARRRVTGDRVQRHRERVGEHGRLVRHRLRTRTACSRGRHRFRVATGHVGRHAGVDSGLDVAVTKAPAQAVIALLDRPDKAVRSRAARRTATDRAPRVALPPAHRPSVPAATTSATTSWPMTCGNEQNAAIALSASSVTEIQQDLLGVRTADPGQPRSSDHPIVMQQFEDPAPATALPGLTRSSSSAVGAGGHLELSAHAEYQRTHQGVGPGTPGPTRSDNVFGVHFGNMPAQVAFPQRGRLVILAK